MTRSTSVSPRCSCRSSADCSAAASSRIAAIITTPTGVRASTTDADENPLPHLRGRGESPSAVADLEHLDSVAPSGRAQLDGVAFARLQERAGDGRDPAHLAAVEIGLVDADDGDGVLLAARVG